MPLNQKFFAISLALIFFLIVLDLARRKKLRVEYTILWTATSVVILILVFWYDSLVWITNLIGAVLPTTTLFLFGLMFLLFVNLHFSVKLSRLSEEVKNLAQEFALHTMKKKSEIKTAGDQDGKTEHSPPHSA